MARSTKKKGGGKKGKSGKPQATVSVIPVQGSPSTSTVDLKGGCTAGQACEKLGVSTEKKNLSVGGNRVGCDYQLQAGDTLQVEERPQGS